MNPVFILVTLLDRGPVYINLALVTMFDPHARRISFASGEHDVLALEDFEMLKSRGYFLA